MTDLLKLLGAVDTVTGSLSLLESNQKKYLIDCGQFQGAKEVRARNRVAFPFNPEDIEAVFLTHAHLDHIGRLPLLVKGGFQGAVYCSKGTADLGRVILLDSAHLEEEFAKYANATGYSRHKPAVPLFTTEDAEKAIDLFQPMARNQWHKITSCLSLRLLRAGHIVGSSILQLQIHHGHKNKILTFSGDLGRKQSLTLKEAEFVDHSDFVIMESTYGNRKHSQKDFLPQLASIVNRVYHRKGVLVIPAFAVGRSQDIIYALSLLEHQKRIPTIPIHLDSPMATQATEIFLKSDHDQKISNAFQGVKFFPEKFSISTTSDESMLLCMKEGPMVVITASGMLSGGRILHHLKARLPHPENLVLFCGYQAEGSKGRYLQENYRTGTLRIHHKETPIEAEIATLEALSAHADEDEIIDWLRHLQGSPKIYLNHGSQESQESLAEKINNELAFNAVPSINNKMIEVS